MKTVIIIYVISWLILIAIRLTNRKRQKESIGRLACVILLAPIVSICLLCAVISKHMPTEKKDNNHN